MTKTVIFLTSGTTWTVPLDWDNVFNSIETIGGGGGAAMGQNGVANGNPGGGGAYSRIGGTALTPGATLNISVGTGGSGGATLNTSGVGGADTWLANNNTATVITSPGVIVGAKGGGGGTTSTSGTGGVGASGVGSTKFDGGGGGHVSGHSGGGGGAAGRNGVGAGGGIDDNSQNGGAGGGGGGGGTGGGVRSGTTGGPGGTNSQGLGSGAGGTNGNSGTSGTIGGGGGGGGAGTTTSGGDGGPGNEWDSTHGSGGGGGQNSGNFNATSGRGGDGGLYGGGGGGLQAGAVGMRGGNGAQGIIVITYGSDLQLPTPPPSLQRLLIQNNSAYTDPTIDDDQTARTLTSWRENRVVSWLTLTLSVSKLLQYEVMAPPDADVSAAKFSQYVVIETLPSIIRSPMLEIERRIINPWKFEQDDEEYSANFRRLKFRPYAGATAINANVNLTGVAGAGHAGTVTVEIDHGITGVAGHGEAGSLNAISGTAILGVAGIGQAGTVTAAVQTSILGVAGSGHAGTLAPVLSPPILGVAGHGQAGTIGVRTEEGIVIAGVAGHGEVGTLTVSLNPLHTLPGLSAKGLAGTVGVHIDIDRPNIPIESAWGWGQAGTISTHQTTNLTGVAGHGQAGTLSTTTSQPGLIMIGLSGALLPSGTNDVYFSVRWSDDGGQTWGNPLVQSFGGTGNYLTFPTVKNLGQGRDRVFEISMSAPIATALSGIFVESEVVSS